MNYTNDMILKMDRSTFEKLFYGAIVDVEETSGLRYRGVVEEIGLSADIDGQTHDYLPVDIVLNGKKIDIVRIKELEIQRKYEG